MYILDTMVISEEMKSSPDIRVAVWLERRQTTDLYLSVTTIAEIERGIAKQKPRDPGYAAKLEAWVDRLEHRFGSRLLVVDRRAAAGWGRLWQQLGFNSPDLIIAATALVHDLTVVTRNTRHFDRTGVTLLNPYEAGA